MAEQGGSEQARGQVGTTAGPTPSPSRQLQPPRKGFVSGLEARPWPVGAPWGGAVAQPPTPGGGGSAL